MIRKIIISGITLFVLQILNFVLCTEVFCSSCDYDATHFLFQFFFEIDALNEFSVSPSPMNIITCLAVSLLMGLIYPDRK
ncbi:hypothetical protein [Flavobacterium sp.]|uniref:hypothetical protein n=1 Tax=Flavobacterium sp. TaxID=239 RepID=UPI0022C98508|nr:hypothetical protein [Flavobacterium sp.]